MRRVAWILATTVLVAGCGSSGSERVGQKERAGARVLTMLDPIGNPERTTPFGDAVARLSDGTLRIRVIKAGHSAQTDYEGATIRDMQHGRADLAIAWTRAWDAFGVRGFDAFGAPLLIDSYPLEQRVLTSTFAARLLEGLQPLGLVGLGYLPGPMSYPFAAARRLVAPADYAGLTIGTQQSRVADITMRALGARPVRQSTVISDLSGLGGLERAVSAIEGDGLALRGSHITSNVDLWPRPLVVFASSRSFERLTGEQRDVLRKAAAEVVSKTTSAQGSREAESGGNLCRAANVTFDVATPGEVAALRRAVEPVYRYLERDSRTATAIATIERLKKQVAAPADALPSCRRPAASSAPAAAALDGVWRMDTDRSASRPEYLDENWGNWVYVFDHGRFAVTQENRTSCTWGYGTYSVKGNQTAWRFTDGGGIAPNNATNKPGEFFVFNMSRYRDTMTLGPVPGQISPLNFRAKPWRRLSSAPTRTFFSKRCPPPAEALSG